MPTVPNKCPIGRDVGTEGLLVGLRDCLSVLWYARTTYKET